VGCVLGGGESGGEVSPHRSGRWEGQGRKSKRERVL
jgi:hypothetical protein